MTLAHPHAVEAEGRPPAPAAPPSRWAGVLTVAVAGLTPITAYLANLGFAPLIALAGLLCLPLLFRSRRPDVGQAILCALAVWALASMAWSIATPSHLDFGSYERIESITGLKLVMQLALYGAFVAASLTLSRPAGARASLVLAIGLLAISALFIVEAVFKAPLYQWIRTAIGQATPPDWAQRDVARVAYVLALLFWPVTLRLAHGRLGMVAAGLLAVATVAGAYLLNADAPLAALVVSTVVFVAVRLWGRVALMIWLGVLLLYLLAAPLLVQGLGAVAQIHPAPGDRVESWAIRLDIWRFTVERIMERPFFGWGLDASRMFSPNIPLHTHSAALQIWLELGAVGASLAALFWVWIGTRLDALESQDRNLAAAACACASAYLTIGALSFGVWQEWWLALGALAVAACAALRAARRPELEGG